ncbi:MAG: hypothetical protein ABF318_18165, partial [Ketobacter sp.]
GTETGGEGGDLGTGTEPGNNQGSGARCLMLKRNKNGRALGSPFFIAFIVWAFEFVRLVQPSI